MTDAGTQSIIGAQRQRQARLDGHLRGGWRRKGAASIEPAQAAKRRQRRTKFGNPRQGVAEDHRPGADAALHDIEAEALHAVGECEMFAPVRRACDRREPGESTKIEAVATTVAGMYRRRHDRWVEARVPQDAGSEAVACWIFGESAAPSVH